MRDDERAPEDGPPARASYPPGTLRIGSIARCGRAGPLLLAARGAADRLLPRSSRRRGPARARRNLEVRRGGGLRRAALPVGAPPRDLPRPDGPALRPRRALDQPDLPGRCHRDRLRGPHTRTGVQDRGRRSVDLHRRRGCRDGLVLPRARRSDRSRARWPGRRQPGRGGAQPRYRGCLWTAAECCGQPCGRPLATCTAARLSLPGVVAWLPCWRSATRRSCVSCSTTHRTSSTTCWPSSSPCSCGPARPSRSSAHASGAACPRSRPSRSPGA